MKHNDWLTAQLIINLNFNFIAVCTMKSFFSIFIEHAAIKLRVLCGINFVADRICKILPKGLLEF